MKLELQINENIKIVSEPIPYDKGKNYYYVKFRTFELFGLLKMWWYVLHDTPMGLMHRPFYSMESAQEHINNVLIPKYLS